MIDLIYDCDLTMGLPGRDVDDGLALLYLLGSPAVRPLGVTTTFGNSSIEEVHPCLLSVLDELGRSDIPAYRGASREDAASSSGSSGNQHERDLRAESDAARFLADTVKVNPGTVSILATGSPTNLLGAYRLHSGFFQDVERIVFMGGITEPLLINGREMAELNFTSDPEAALYSLYSGESPSTQSAVTETHRSSQRSAGRTRCRISVITGNLCLQALLTRERFHAFIQECRRSQTKRIASYLEEKILPWFSFIERTYGLRGFHAWDATAAVYLTDPELFEPQEVVLRSTPEDLRSGFLRTQVTAGKAAPANARPQRRHGQRIDVPSEIRDLPAYWRLLFKAWSSSMAVRPAWRKRDEPGPGGILERISRA